MLERSKLERVKLVIFEGCDKSGKTTLFRKFRAATDYIPLAIDRFTGSNLVYDRYYERESNTKNYLRSEGKLQMVYDCYLVVLTADDEVIHQRIVSEESGEPKRIALDNYRLINEGFRNYHRESKYKNKLILDTGELSISECLEQILLFTREEKKVWGIY